MASNKVIAQRLAATRTFDALVRENGSSWWAALDGLQLSPTEPFGGPAFRGRDRLVLAMAALDRGLRDRRWSTGESLGANGLKVRRGERPVALDAGDGQRLLYNVGQANAARGRRDGHAGASEAEASVGTMDEADIARASRTLWPRCPCRVLLDSRRDASYDPALGIVLVPNDSRWGRDPRDLRGLLEAVALSLAAMDDIGGDAGRGLAASIASAMALSDLGIAPSEASVGSGRASKPVGGDVPWLEAANDPEALLSCADAADGLSRSLTGLLGDAVGYGGPGGDAMPTDAAKEGEEGRGEEGIRQDGRLRDEADESDGPDGGHGPTRGVDAIPYGRYTLRDTVSGARHASDALSGRLMGADGGCGH